MILEHALLALRPGEEAEFERAFAEAQTIIARMSGYRGHQLHRCIEREHVYLLLVEWDSLADHEQGFRQSPDYQRWKQQLHHFYQPFPTVEHFTPVFPKS